MFKLNVITHGKVITVLTSPYSMRLFAIAQKTLKQENWFIVRAVGFEPLKEKPALL